MVKSLLLITGLLFSRAAIDVGDRLNSYKYNNRSDNYYASNIVDSDYSIVGVHTTDYDFVNGFTVTLGIQNFSSDVLGEIGLMNSNYTPYYDDINYYYQPTLTLCSERFYYEFNGDSWIFNRFDNTSTYYDIFNVSFWSADAYYFLDSGERYTNIGLNYLGIFTSLVGTFNFNFYHYVSENGHDYSYDTISFSHSNKGADSNVFGFDLNDLPIGDWLWYATDDSLGADGMLGVAISYTPVSNNDYDVEIIGQQYWQTGYDTGYINGYNKGIDDSNQYNFNTLFGSIANTPILYLKALFNFEFFGIKLYQVVLGLITALLVLWVVKKVV